MSYDDDRDMYGNVRSPSYSSDEASRAGADRWDTQAEVDYKVYEARRKQWEAVLSPPTDTGSSPYPSSGGGSGVSISPRGMLAFFLRLACIAAIGYFCYLRIQGLHEAHYAGSDTRMYMFDISYVPPKGTKPSFAELKSAMTGRFRERYGQLFASNTPWDELYKDCKSRQQRCLINPYKGVEHLRSFAIKPASVMEDICEINASDYHVTPVDFLFKPVWRVQFEESPKEPPSPHCVVENGDKYIEKVRTTVRVMSWAYAALGVLASMLAFAGIKKLLYRPGRHSIG
jgi:hypothetical protein